MRLTEAQRETLSGKKGRNPPAGNDWFGQYGDAIGADEFIPISSAHTSLCLRELLHSTFPPDGFN